MTGEPANQISDDRIKWLFDNHQTFIFEPTPGYEYSFIFPVPAEQRHHFLQRAKELGCLSLGHDVWAPDDWLDSSEDNLTDETF